VNLVSHRRAAAACAALVTLLPLHATAAEPRWNFNEPPKAPPRPAAAKPPARPAAPAKDSAAPQPKEITGTAPKALVVLDRHCPQLVQPYKLSDNAATLAIFGAKETLTDVLKRAPPGFTGLAPRSGGAPQPALSGEVSASMRAAAKQLNWLPMPAEVAYGQRLHEQQTLVLERDSRLGRQHYPTADRLLQQLLAGVGQPHEYKFRLYILKSSGRNAMALPGGFLYIDQGLVDTPAALPKAQFALAHEIAHVLQRHETKELQSVVVDSIQSRQDLARVMTVTRNDPNALFAFVKAEKNRYTQHHVDQELQADSCAVRLLSRVLPDRAALAESINVFMKDLPPPTAAPKPATNAGPLAGIVDSPLKRHPTTNERLQNLRAIYADVTASPPAR